MVHFKFFNLCILGDFSYFLSFAASLNIILHYKKKSFWGITAVSVPNSLNVGPHLGLNCLHRMSTDNKFGASR